MIRAKVKGTCTPGSQSWSVAASTAFTVPPFCTRLTIDLRGPGSGWGGGGDLNTECAGGGGGGGGGYLAGSVDGSGLTCAGSAGTYTEIKRGTTVIARAKLGKGGDGGAGSAASGGAGGGAGTDVAISGLTITALAGSAGAKNGSKITGSFTVMAGETLTVQIGRGGGGGCGACDSAVSPPVLSGAPGTDGTLTISW